MRFAIFGTGGHGRVVAPLAEEFSRKKRSISQESMQSSDVVFVVDAENRSSQINGVNVIGFEELCSPAHRDRQVVVAIGDGRVRERIEGRCITAGLNIGSLFSPTTRILSNNLIGNGSIFSDFTAVTSNVKIGKSFQCNIYSYVEHDCVIGDYVTFAPRVSCNGNVHIGDFAYIGTSATFIQGKPGSPLLIGEGAVVGMGSVVTKPVDPYTLVVGVPAKFVRELPRP